METGAKNNGPRMPFLAFTQDGESAAVIKQFAQAHGWDEGIVHHGDSAAAADFLKSHPSPQVLFVDVPSAQAAPGMLNALADVCDPAIKVIVSGTINEYSFYCWLTEVGISGYLLKPFTLAALEAAYHKAAEPPASSGAPHAVAAVAHNAKVIAVIGTRGGAGASTVSVNMAWILSSQMRKKTALLDLDPQLGTVALALDLEPVKGVREVLEKPERMDGLFLDRVMFKADDMLSVLSTEESLEDDIRPNAEAAETLLKQIRPKFAYVVIDLPRTLSPFTRYALKHADHIICVTEYGMAGLRESLRYLDYCRDVLKVALPLFVGNRTGMAGKHQMPQDEFEKGLGQKVAYNIPFALDAYATAVAGEILAEKHPGSPAAKALYALTAHFVPGMEVIAPQTPLAKAVAWLKGGK